MPQSTPRPYSWAWVTGSSSGPRLNGRNTKNISKTISVSWGRNSLHQPALLHEVIDGLSVKPGKIYLDCTVGSGGHAEAIVAQGGKVYGLDVDPGALERTKARLGNKIELKQANFAGLKQAAQDWGLTSVAGILLDLGLSTEQIEDRQRGFSWGADAPLDMRADPNLKVTAADLLNGLGRTELIKLFRVYGEEHKSRQIAEAVISRRPLTTTGQLVEIIETVTPLKPRSHHPATLVFQALRIAVNDELNNLKTALPQAVDLLAASGRLAVISFHSLEDRIVKNFMRDTKNLTTITKKPIIGERPHAILRVAEKL